MPQFRWKISPVYTHTLILVKFFFVQNPSLLPSYPSLCGKIRKCRRLLLSGIYDLTLLHNYMRLRTGNKYIPHWKSCIAVRIVPSSDSKSDSVAPQFYILLRGFFFLNKINVCNKRNNFKFRKVPNYIFLRVWHWIYN